MPPGHICGEPRMASRVLSVVYATEGTEKVSAPGTVATSASRSMMMPKEGLQAAHQPAPG